MIKKHADRIRWVYGIVLSITISIAGICLIGACIGIYQGYYQVGEHLFSRDAVAAAFSEISVPVYLCVALVLGGVVLEILLPCNKTKPQSVKQPAMILKQLREKTALSACNSSLQTAITKLRKKRILCKGVTAGILFICAVVFLIYALNGSNYHTSEINASMLRAMTVLLPCLTVSFVCVLFCVCYCNTGMRKEIELLKQVDRDAKAEPQYKESVSFVYVRCALLLIATALLVYGFVTGGTVDVLTKAVNICTECVGLG